ncbi:MAG: glycosyltransferase [Planctomycetes bacterium]|nr:glycosyltransferase [Planctomycetota bacterium]
MDNNKTTKSESPKSNSKRIVLIASARTFMEYPLYLRYLLVAMVDESIPVMLVCPGNVNQAAILSGVEIVTYPALNIPFTGHFNKKMLLEKIKKFNPSIIHCLCQSFASLARRLSRNLDIPYLLNVNALQKRYGGLSMSSHRLAKIIVPAESIAENISQLFHKYTDRIVQINMGCFVDDESLCFSDNSVLAGLLVADDLDEVGRFKNLLSAAGHLILDGYEFMLVIMGKGSGENAIRNYIRKNGLSENVIVVAPLESEHHIVRDCDIYIQPWPSDSYNAIAIEAAACGAAVLTCAGGVDDMFCDRENCLLFDPADEISIRLALKELLDKREYAKTIDQNAKQYVKQNHSMSKMITSLQQLYTGYKTGRKDKLGLIPRA